MIREQCTAVTAGAVGLAVKQLHPVHRCIREARFTRKVAIQGAVITAKFLSDEGGEGICNLGDCDLIGGVDVIERLDKHGAIGGDGAHPFGDNRPTVINSVVHGARHFVFLGSAGHFCGRGQREQGLRGQQ